MEANILFLSQHQNELVSVLDLCSSISNFKVAHVYTISSPKCRHKKLNSLKATFCFFAIYLHSTKNMLTFFSISLLLSRSPGNSNTNLWSSGDCTSSTPSVHSEHNSVSYGSLERADHLWDPDQHDLGSSFLPEASVVFADSRYASRDQPRQLQCSRERLHYTKSLQQQQLPLFASQLSGHMSDRPVTSSQNQQAGDVEQRHGRVLGSDKWRAPEHAKPQADVFRGNEHFETNSQNVHGALPHDKVNGRDILYAQPATNGSNLAPSDVFDKELLVKKLLAQQHAQQLPPGGVSGGYGGDDSVHEKGFDRGRLYMDMRPCDSHALQFRSQPPVGNVLQPISIMTQSPNSYLNGGYSNPCTPDSLTDGSQMPFEVQQQQQQQAIAVTNARYNRMLMQQQQQQHQQKVAYQKFIPHAVPRQSAIAPMYERRPTVTTQSGPPTLAPYRGAHSFPFYTHRQRHVSDTGYDVCYTGTEACLPHGSLSLPDHFSAEQRVPFSKEFAYPCHRGPIIDDVILSSEFAPGFPPATTAFPAKFHPGYPPPHLHGQFGVEATFDPYCQQFDPYFRSRVAPPFLGSGHDVYFDMFSHHFVNGIPPFFHGFKPPR